MKIKKIFLVVNGEVIVSHPQKLTNSAVQTLIQTAQSITDHVGTDEEVLIWAPREEEFQNTAKIIQDILSRSIKKAELEIKDECWGHVGIHSKESFESSNDFQWLRNSVANNPRKNIIVVSNINYIRNITKFYGLGGNEIDYGKAILIKTEGIEI